MVTAMSSPWLTYKGMWIVCTSSLLLNFTVFPPPSRDNLFTASKKKKKKEHRVKHICLTLTVKVCIAWLFGFQSPHISFLRQLDGWDNFRLKSIAMFCAPILANISEGAAWSILLRIWSHGSLLGQFIPQETLGIAWKDCWVSQLGEREGGTGTWWVKTRDAAKPAAMQRTPPQQRPGRSNMSVVPRLRNYVMGKRTHASQMLSCILTAQGSWEWKDIPLQQGHILPFRDGTQSITSLYSNWSED